MDTHDYIGVAGAALILVAYFLLQVGRIDATNIWYSVSNAAGAALIVLSLLFEFNLSAFLIESFWLAISLYGIGIAILRRKMAPERPGMD